VADGHVVAEDKRVLVAHDVEDAAVLNVGARADANVVHVAANHGGGRTLESSPMTTSPMMTAAGSM
jgi:hypothetical protein